MADCHPILYLRMMDRGEGRGQINRCRPAPHHHGGQGRPVLHIKPGTDLALLNGLLHLLHKAGHTNPAFIAQFTQGWEAVEAMLPEYTPQAVSRVTGLAVEDIQAAAELIAAAPEFMTCWTMGLNQSTTAPGTPTPSATCTWPPAKSAAQAPGLFADRPTQCHGRARNGLYGAGPTRSAQLVGGSGASGSGSPLGLPPGAISTELGKGTIDLFEQMVAGVVKACWIICTNPVASVPNRQTVIDGLKAAELVITQDAFLDTETNVYADVLLPGALWAEAEGTMINSERNITLMQQAVAPPGEAMADWRIIAEVAKAMGFSEGFNFASAEEVFEEIKGFTTPKPAGICAVSATRACAASRCNGPCHRSKTAAAARCVTSTMAAASRSIKTPAASARR